MNELNLSHVRFCACANLRKGSRAITQLYDEMLQPSGLRVTQFTVLATISLIGQMTIKALAEELVMDRTTLTRNLKPLEKGGLIESTTGEDRRTRLVRLTSQGQTTLVEALLLWEKAQAKMVEGLGQETLDSLLGLLSESVTIAQKV